MYYRPLLVIIWPTRYVLKQESTYTDRPLAVYSSKKVIWWWWVGASEARVNSEGVVFAQSTPDILFPLFKIIF